MAGVVLKQSYKSLNRKNTPMLNGKHLIYISTRPGTVYNQECGFGLFGKLPNSVGMTSINNLGHAKKMINDISKRRTVYRAIISLDDKTAKDKGA